MLQIEYVSKADLKPYVNNAKIHDEKQIEQIKKSIRDFGFNDPIAVWKDNEIIEGHGRLLAVMEMNDIQKVPIIRLDRLSDEQRKAYTLVHNKLTMNTDFDIDMLNLELTDIPNFDMNFYGFNIFGDDSLEDELDTSKYTKKIKAPHYEPTGTIPDINDLCDTEKTDALIDEIEKSDLSEEQKQFLRLAAYRHSVFNYKMVAEYYAHADEKMQRLMEKSALVIIDINNAVEDGYVVLEQKILDMIDED
jgi:hypothetical protein